MWFQIINAANTVFFSVHILFSWNLNFLRWRKLLLFVSESFMYLLIHLIIGLISTENKLLSKAIRFFVETIPESPSIQYTISIFSQRQHIHHIWVREKCNLLRRDGDSTPAHMNHTSYDWKNTVLFTSHSSTHDWQFFAYSKLVRNECLEFGYQNYLLIHN